MSRKPVRPLTQLARLAAEVGPILVPVGNEELLRSITEAARQLFDAAACSLALLNENEDELHFIMASGTGAETVVGLRMPAGQGIAGWVLMSGQPMAIDDVQQDSRFASGVAERTGYVPTSLLAMPLETDRGAIGVIEVLDRHRNGAAGADDMAMLSVFARQAALAIESSRVFTDLGRALFEAAAAETEDGDLGAALRRYAESAPRPRADFAELAALFYELGLMGADERLLVTRVANDVVSYLRLHSAR
jgi:GAF domain-containing protein